MIEISSFSYLLMTLIGQWLTASVLVLSIAFAMAELASAAPTSGGVRASIHDSPDHLISY